MNRHLLSAGLVFFCVLLVTPTLRGQEILREALASFPTQTIRVEYSGLAALRTVPNYSNLRQRFTGPRLQDLESSLSQLGIDEGDIDELILGWQAGKERMDLYGLASGRFNAQEIANRASTLKLSSTTVAGLPVYCLGQGGASTCVVSLEDSLGAFGALPTLTAMLGARNGETPALSSDDRFVRLTREASRNVPIWGVAVGVAIEDWFKGSSPVQTAAAVDWGRLMQGVDSLIYRVATSDRVRLDAKMYNKSSDAASQTRQLLEGLRLAQRVAWQMRNGARSNPFENMEIQQDGNAVALGVTMPYGALEGISAR